MEWNAISVRVNNGSKAFNYFVSSGSIIATPAADIFTYASYIYLNIFPMCDWVGVCAWAVMYYIIRRPRNDAATTLRVFQPWKANLCMMCVNKALSCLSFPVIMTLMHVPCVPNILTARNSTTGNKNQRVRLTFPTCYPLFLSLRQIETKVEIIERRRGLESCICWKVTESTLSSYWSVYYWKHTRKVCYTSTQ